jgi:hypothetical protein
VTTVDFLAEGKEMESELSKLKDLMKSGGEPPKLRRGQLLELIEMILEAKFEAAGTDFMPKARSLKTLRELRGLLVCVWQSDSLGPVAMHFALKDLLSRRGQP